MLLALYFQAHELATLTMIIRLQGMGFRTGDRVATKKKKPEYGNVVQAVGNKLWDVKLDNGSTVAMKSKSIKKVEAQTALSPVAATDALVAGGVPRHYGDGLVLHDGDRTRTRPRG